MSEPIKNDLYKNILESNAPWLLYPNYRPVVQSFHREAFKRVQQQLEAKHGMAVLIKGPRRVGKTEIQKQLITNLLDKGVSSKRILYLSFDDVQIQSENPKDRWRMVNELLNCWAQMLGYPTYDLIEGQTYCFFDEVQAVENWASLLKTRIDRNPKVKIVLSGSAAHSIFKKSLEILLGRVISESLTPFSFREYFQCKLSGNLSKEEALQDIQTQFERDLSAPELFHKLQQYTAKFKDISMQDHLRSFLKEGGFPQLWLIPENNIIEKAHNIDENYVKKVTLEDLMLLRKIKKPELFERLLRHLFARPGQEYNQVKVASNLETTAVTLADAMELLRQTDLLLFVEKFSARAESLKRKNVKIYPVDLTLTFAMTKIVPSLEDDHQKGFIAESLVAQTLFRLRGTSTIAFMQTQNVLRHGEIDFYLRSDTKDCPIEVKYQSRIRAEDIAFLERIVTEKKLEGGIVITPNDWGQIRAVSFIPLWAFALIS